MAWLYVPGLECSTKACAPAGSASAWSTDPFVTSSGTPMRRPCSWPGWKRRPWIKLLSGTIWPTSTLERGAARWIALWRGSRAKAIALPESACSTPTRATAGRWQGACFATWEPNGSFWKTSQGSLFQGADAARLPQGYSESWPKTGGMRSGCVYRRPAWAPATGESGSSCWPTARAEDGEGCGNHPGAMAGLWTSPVVTDRANRGKRARKSVDFKRGGEANLADDVEHWTTPQAHDVTERGRGQKPTAKAGNACLARDARTWPTPNSRDHKGADLESRHGGASLSHFAESGERIHWQTPQTPQTPRGGGAARSGERGTEALLPGQASRFSLPVPVISTAGAALSRTDLSTAERRRLNPAFVCWLMGWPWWWTRAEPISFGARETALWRSRLRSLLWSFTGD